MCCTKDTVFVDLIDCLASYFGEDDVKNCFVWLNFYCLKDPFDVSRPISNSATIAEELVSRYKDMVVFLPSLTRLNVDAHSSLLLKAAIHAKKELRFILPYRVKTEFVRDLTLGLGDTTTSKEQEEGLSLYHDATAEYRGGELAWLNRAFLEKVQQIVGDVACTGAEEKLEKGDVYEFLKFMAFLSEINRINSKEAVALLNEAEKTIKELFGPSGDKHYAKDSTFALEYVEMLNELGLLKMQQDLDEDAKGVFIIAYEVLSELDEEMKGRPAFEAVVGKTMHSLALAYRSLSDLDKAEKFARRAVEVTSDLNRASPSAAQALCTYADVMSDMRKHKKAEGFYVESLKTWKSLVKENPEEIGYQLERNLVRNNFATLLAQMGSFQEAIVETKKCIEFEEKHYGKNSFSLATNYDNLANYLAALFQEERDQQFYDDAKKYFDKALELKLRYLPENHVSVAKTKFDLALLLRDNNEDVEAGKLGREALEVFKRVLGEDNPRTKSAQKRFG